MQIPAQLLSHRCRHGCLIGTSHRCRHMSLIWTSTIGLAAQAHGLPGISWTITTTKMPQFILATIRPSNTKIMARRCRRCPEVLPSLLRVELPTKASITVVSLISAARQLPCVSIRTPDLMVALFLDVSKMTFTDELTTTRQNMSGRSQALGEWLSRNTSSSKICSCDLTCRA